MEPNEEASPPDSHAEHAGATAVFEFPQQAAYTVFFEQSASVMLVIDPADGRIIDANAAAARFYGHSREMLKSQDIPGLQAAPVEKILARLGDVVRGLARVQLTQHRLADGTFTPVEVHASAVKLQGRVLICEIVHDISSRIETENALRASESRQRRLIETMRDGFAVQDSDGRLTYVNERLCEILGYARAELLGRHVTELGDRNLLERRPTGSYDAQLLTRKGRQVDVRVSARAIVDDRGEFQGAFAVVADMTERIALEEQLRHAQKMEAVGRLAGGIAHDFNNLLSAIIGFAEIGARELGPDHRVVTRLERVLDAGHRARKLTAGLLAFSRKQVLQMAPTDVSAVAARLQSILHGLMGDDVTFETQLEPDPGTVRADAAQIEHVLMNLCVNARDATEHGGRIRLSTDQVTYARALRGVPDTVPPGAYVRIVVEDNGHGISADVLNKVFEPFFTTKPQGAGTGLGLSMSYGIVKQHGGCMRVESEPGHGTRFEVLLPLAHATTCRTESNESPSEEEEVTGTETVLVAEDEAVVRSLARDILESVGYQVIVAANCEEALATARQCVGDIHLLLTDVIMPGRRGTELYAELIKERRDMRVLFMSGYADSVLDDLDLGMQGLPFVQKPFTVDGLLGHIRAALDARPIRA